MCLLTILLPLNAVPSARSSSANHQLFCLLLSAPLNSPVLLWALLLLPPMVELVATHTSGSKERHNSQEQEPPLPAWPKALTPVRLPTTAEALAQLPSLSQQLAAAEMVPVRPTKHAVPLVPPALRIAVPAVLLDITTLLEVALHVQMEHLAPSMAPPLALNVLPILSTPEEVMRACHAPATQRV